MNVGSWRVGIRIATRTAWRSKGRTILIAAMVGVPITGLVAADTLFRTADVSQTQQVEREFGQADFAASDDPEVSIPTSVAPVIMDTVPPESASAGIVTDGVFSPSVDPAKVASHGIRVVR